jgi:ubiquinone/menaquinone biosynthesis C-methylase UbiE
MDALAVAALMRLRTTKLPYTMMTEEYRLRTDAELFDELADEYESWYATPLGAFVIHEEEQALLAGLPASPGRLLDIGAGTGWWSRILSRRGFQVTALEPSAGMRRIGATESDQPIDWRAGSAEELAFPDAAFDIALLVTVLEFVAEPFRAMAEAWRVLRAGGTLLVGHLDPLSPWAAHYRHLADKGIAPWSGARFVESEQIAQWLGRPPDGRASCVFLSPNAAPPFEAADRAGRRAGNAGAFAVLGWRKSA